MRWQLLLAAVMLRAAHSTLAQSRSLYAVATRKWVEGFVVAKKLCPWAAAAAASEETMRVTVLPGAFNTPRASLALTSAVLAEAKSLAAPANAGKTTLIVLPHSSLASSFPAYLDAAAAVEALLTSSRLDASIQLATFHPLYQFAGTRPDSPENFTNRSPYPVLHLLRVADVEGAIRTYTRLKVGVPPSFCSPLLSSASCAPSLPFLPLTHSHAHPAPYPISATPPPLL